MQPRGLCTEFDHVVYVCDPQPGCIKLFSTMGERGKNFNTISSTYDAFSIHSKGERYSVKSVDDASELMLSCRQYFKENEAEIQASTGKTAAVKGSRRQCISQNN